MIDSPQTDEQNIQHDEAYLNQLEPKEKSIEGASHYGFTDAGRRTRLLCDIDTAETKVLHEKERLAANRD